MIPSEFFNVAMASIQGGYTGSIALGEVRTKELLLRWAEYSAFTPVMRTHEGNHPDANHQVKKLDCSEELCMQYRRKKGFFGST